MADQDPEDSGKPVRWWRAEKEDIDRRIDERLQANEQRYSGVSNEDVEQFFTSGAQRVRETYAAQTTSSKLRLYAGIGLLAAGMLASAAAVWSVEAEREAAAEHAQEIDLIEAEIADLGSDAQQLADEDPASAEAETEVSEETVETLREYLETAESRAEEVAATQNEFAELYYAAESEDRPGEGLPTASEEAAVGVREAMGDEFAESSFVVGDEVVQMPTVAPPFGSDEIDPRWPWHLQVDEGSYVDDSSYGWEVMTRGPSSVETPQQITVVWGNYDADGVLLAWAEAVYSVEDEIFSDLVVTTTTHGTDDLQRDIPDSPVGDDSLIEEDSDDTDGASAAQDRRL